MPETREKQGAVAKLDNTKFALEHAELWKFLKSCVAGGAGAIPEMVLYMVLAPLFSKYDWSVPNFFFFDILVRTKQSTEGHTIAAVVYAILISTAVGQVIGFILNRKMAFHANNNVVLSLTLTFLLIVVTIALNTLVVGPGIDAMMSYLTFLPQWLIDMITKILSMCISVGWVYPANRFIIHRQVKEKADV